MFPPFAERLAQAGFTAVSLNLSGSGVDDSGEFTQPEKFGHNTFSAERQDTRAVIDALTNGDMGVAAPSVLGLVGHSRGGGVGVLLTAQDPRIRALVTWAAIASVDRWPPDQRLEWRQAGRIEVRNARTGQVLPLYTDVLDDIERNGSVLDIEAAAERIQVPWLLIHGSHDESVRFAEAELLKEASRSESTRLLRVESGGHTFGAVHPWRCNTPELESVFDATLAWLAAHLR